MTQGIEAHLEDAQTRIASAASTEDLRAIEREFTGKDGVVASMLAAIPTLPPEQRKDAGQSANRLKTAVLESVAAREAQLANAALETERQADGFDATLPPPRLHRGTLHPVTQVTRELEDLFTSMGYRVLDGPEVELDEYYTMETRSKCKYSAGDGRRGTPSWDMCWAGCPDGSSRATRSMKLLHEVTLSPLGCLNSLQVFNRKIAVSDFYLDI